MRRYRTDRSRVLDARDDRVIEVHLDGHKVGRMVERRMVAKAAIPRSGNRFDGRSTYVPVDVG